MKVSPERYRAYTRRNIHELPQYSALPPEHQEAIQVVSTVFPFRTNSYVVNELIDWSDIPNDPIFRLTFPVREMLPAEDYARVRDLLADGADQQTLTGAVNAIRMQHNPHPAGQMQYNVPRLDGQPVPGLQHKYHETVLFFPAQGQTCHAFCTYCFRWAQFVGIDELKFAASDIDPAIAYLRQHPEVTDILFTGGDPGIMKTRVWDRYINALLDARLEGLQSIRVGTKALAYWPGRFVTDRDADELLRVLEGAVARGMHIAVMAHFSHPAELRTDIVREAIRRLRSAGCEIRMQAPLIRGVNDDPGVWAELWREGVRLGMIPYYMFVERDTGPRGVFEVPLARAQRIFREAFSQVSGLGRTVRGPVMSATPGKVHVHSVQEIGESRYFMLSFLQARDPAWVGRPFLAEFDRTATWLRDLTPAFGEDRFFFEGDYTRFVRGDETSGVPEAEEKAVNERLSLN